MLDTRGCDGRESQSDRRMIGASSVLPKRIDNWLLTALAVLAMVALMAPVVKGNRD